MRRLLILAATLAAFTAPARAETAGASLALWRLDCGSIAVKDLSLFSDTFDYAGQKRALTDSCYLIRHGDDYMLWDTGLPEALLGAPDKGDAMSPSLKQTLTAQLGRIGVEPAKIGRIGLSHYHFDHAGQAAAFPGATLLIGAADLTALKGTPPPFGAEPALLAHWLTGPGKVQPVSGDLDVFGDGSVTMLATPGHTPGSMALLVRLPKTGAVLLSGDVAHVEAQFARNGVPPFNSDRAQSLASMDRLTRIAKRLRARLIVQHDADDIGKLPTFPEKAE